MMKLLKDPLLHFFLAGAALFAADHWLSRGEAADAPDGREVRITEGHVRWVAATWSRQWQREPSRDELRGLVRDLLKEELLAREARELGLEQDDTVVRRRLAQKMTFLVEDASRLARPTDDELRQFYDAHRDRYRRQARVSFMHVFFSRTGRVDAATDARLARAELASLGGTAGASNRGDRSLIDSRFNGADESAVAAQFGREFAQAVFAFEPGTWHGPIESAYGLHLVRVSDKAPGELRPLPEVKLQVVEDWREQQRRASQERYFAELAGKYEIVADDSVAELVGPLALGAELAK